MRPVRALEGYAPDHRAVTSSAAMRPTVFISGARGAYLGPGLQLDPHKVAVGVIVIALDHPAVLRYPDQGARSAISGEIVFVPADVMHHLTTDGRMFFLYLDPLDFDRLDRDAVVSDAATFVRRAVDKANPLCLSRVVAGVCNIAGLDEQPAVDCRLATVIRLLERDPDAFATVEMAAATAGLSTSRFQHLFVAATGVSFRRYRLWRRMALVAGSLSAGGDLTSAAHDAGFSSSAHLSTAFRKMFGLAPSWLLKAGVRIETEDFEVTSRLNPAHQSLPLPPGCGE